MSNAYPPPGSHGRPQDQPPPYGQQYGQPYGAPGGQQGQPGGPQQPPPHQQPPPGYPPQQPGQAYPPPQTPQQPQEGWGQPAGQWGQGPPGSWDYGAQADYSAYAAYQKAKRPGTVLGGAIMSYIGCGILLLLGLAFVLGSASTGFLEGFAGGAGLPDASLGMLRGILIGFGAVAVVWSAIIIVLTVFAQKGRGGARIGLTIAGILYLLVGLFGAIVGQTPQTLVGIVYVAVAIALFWLGGANEWYRAQKSIR